MNIAVLGFGTIGSGVVRIIDTTEKLEHLKVTKILDLKENQYKDERIVCDIEEILNDESIDLVVETLGGLTPSYEYILGALNHHKHVVTANKRVVNTHFEEFTTLAKKNNVGFSYEASVAGGIPWIAEVKKVARIDDINSFSGIFNGTTNYILSRMYNEGLPFEYALKQAQEEGYAERDPSADIDGIDVMDKVKITSSVCFNGFVKDDLMRLSLRNLKAVDLQFFSQQGYIIKYCGYGFVQDGDYYGCVSPIYLPKENILTHVNSNFNMCSVNGRTIGNLKFYGQGAGKYPTANAVIQDILDIDTNHYVATQVTGNLHYNPNLMKHYYVIRTDTHITSDKISYRHYFDNHYYYYTNKLTDIELNELLSIINDDTAFIAQQYAKEAFE